MGTLYPLANIKPIDPGKGGIPDQQRSTTSNNSTLLYLARQRKAEQNKFADNLSQDFLEGLRGETLTLQTDAYKKWQEKWTDVYTQRNGKLNMDDKVLMQQEQNALSRNQKQWVSAHKNYEDQMYELTVRGHLYDQEESNRELDINDKDKIYLVPKYQGYEKLITPKLSALKEDVQTSSTTYDETKSFTSSSTELKALQTPEQREGVARDHFRGDGEIRRTATKRLRNAGEDIQEQYRKTDPVTGEESYDVESFFVKDAEKYYKTKDVSTRSATIKPKKKTKVARSRVGGYDQWIMSGKPMTVSQRFHEAYDENNERVEKPPIITGGRVVAIKEKAVGKEGRTRKMAEIIYSEKEDASGSGYTVSDVTDAQGNVTGINIIGPGGKSVKSKIIYVPVEDLGSQLNNIYSFDDWDGSTLEDPAIKFDEEIRKRGFDPLPEGWKGAWDSINQVAKDQTR